MNELMIKIGLRDRIESAQIDPKERLTELGINPTNEKAEEKWNNEPDFEGHQSSDQEYIDPGFFQIDFKINGKVFKMAVDHILRIKHEDLTDPNADTYDAQLEACSYYRFSFFAAAQQVAIQRKEIERAFRRWLAQKQDEHRRLLSIGRKEERSRHNLNSKDQPGITKDEILDRILLDSEDGPEYENFQSQVDNLRQKEDLLIELRDALHDRGFHIGGIADRLFQQRRKQEF